MDKRQSEWNIKKDSILQKLAPEEVEALDRHCDRILKKRGELIWVDEDDGAKVYIVDQGIIRLTKVSNEGKRLILGMLGPAQFFGAVTPALTQAEPYDSIEVVRDARLIAIDAKVFHEVLKNHPEMTMRMAQVLEDRRRNLERKITSLVFKSISARVAELLAELCERFSYTCPNSDGIQRDIALTHQEIADLAGAARPTVSSIISDLIKQGILEKHDQVLCVRDLDRLKEMADEETHAL